MSAANAKKLNDALEKLAPFIASARTVGATPGRRSGVTSPPRGSKGSSKRAQAQPGSGVGAVGRVPDAIVQGWCKGGLTPVSRSKINRNARHRS